jgi:hypothetical protein
VIALTRHVDPAYLMLAMVGGWIALSPFSLTHPCVARCFLLREVGARGERLGSGGQRVWVVDAILPLPTMRLALLRLKNLLCSEPQ